MQCYILQGVVGVLALAAILAVIIGMIWLIGAVIDWAVYRTCRVPDWIETALTVVVIIFSSLMVSLSAWMIGGDILKKFFHFCTA